jgi:hypothetical protein
VKSVNPNKIKNEGQQKTTPTAWQFVTEQAYQTTPEQNINRTSQITWEYYIPASSQNLTVTINWKDKTTGAPMSKIVPNIVMSANKKTIITGYLYGIPDNPGGSDYIVRYNSDWSSDSTVVNIN